MVSSLTASGKTSLARKTAFLRYGRFREYEVSLALRQVSQFRNAIVVYINGEFRGKWLTEDCEERRRFFPCKKRCLTNTNELKKMGIRSKKEIQKFKEMATCNTYSSAWTSFNAMKKHFETNNNSIEILEE